MNRAPSTVDTTWFIDLDSQEKLDLDPPYQRKSIWTVKDRQYFLDTIFRNYPSPTIFLHTDRNVNGKTTYHVVDGKQRLETILKFSNNELKISNTFGSNLFAGKLFKELNNNQKNMFWNYQLTIDYVSNTNLDFVNEVFDRLNRVSKTLKPQELRHAKYNGWFIQESENENKDLFWRDIGLSTIGNARRMRDIQFVSELLMVILEDDISGFDQDHITQIYVNYDDLRELKIEFDEEFYLQKKHFVKNYVEQMIKGDKVIKNWTKTSNHFYILWSLIALSNEEDLPSAENLTKKYITFMNKVSKIAKQDKKSIDLNVTGSVHKYWINMGGANTDLNKRKDRLVALREALLSNEVN